MLDADLLVHVVDGSDVNPMAQIEAVREVIREVQSDHHAAPAPELLVVNKIDAATDLTLAQLRARCPARYSCPRTPGGHRPAARRMGNWSNPVRSPST